MPAIAAAGMIAVCFAAISYALCGATLGMLLCGLFAAALLIALLDNPTRAVRHRILLVAAVVGGVGIVWLAGVFCSSITFLHCLQAYLVLFSAGTAVFALRLIRIDGRIVAIAWIAWFAAPVLLAPAMLTDYGAGITGTVTRFHPLFALNRVLIDQGAWTSSDIAYRLLTPLGQDVSYALPATVWPCVLCQLGVMAACLAIRLFRGKVHPVATVPC